jgi:V8-like Glu-specific endopeptidase
LVAPDIVATAGHCVVNEITCLENVWTFGLDKTSGQSRKINKREIYRCKELISSRTDHVTKNDFALVRLDRAVVGARPLKLSAINSVLSTQAEYIVVGHPSGLPLKVSIGGKIVDNSQKHYFRMEADTFAGNSGAAVLSLPELEVVGILVRGSLDFKFDRFEGCSIVNRCEEVGKGSDCSGESATRISELTPFLAAPD